MYCSSCTSLCLPCTYLHSSPVRMDMSGSEALSNDASGDVLMSFVMPSKFTKATLPQPRDSDVRIKEVPSHLAAALTFRGHIRSASAGGSACNEALSSCVDGSIIACL